MDNRVLKCVGRPAQPDRLYPRLAMSRVQSATTGILPGRFPCFGLPLMLLVVALFMSALSCYKTGLLVESQDQETQQVMPLAGNMRPDAMSRKQRDVSFGDSQFSSFSVHSSRELIDQLKEFKLWDGIQEDVPPVLFNNFPADLGQINVEGRKKVFVHALLPSIMIVRAEVMQERQELLNILDELGGPDDLNFSPGAAGWQEGISQGQISFIIGLCRKYRTRSSAELLTRVNVLPTSIMLAQAAIESSWGSSRFSTQANNLFGMWTWGQKGLVPAQRDAGKTHKIAIYDSILDSVRSYLLTINRVGAYAGLRRIRNQTMNPDAIVEGLINYSQRKEYYVTALKELIKHNNLGDYDKCRLADAG